MNLSGKEAVKIAVTYEGGNIFGHFGQTKRFKIYETVNGEIISSYVTDTGGVTHCSLGGWLYENGVNVLICGGLGAGASKALTAAGILVYAGNSGNADEAVQKLLNKELVYNPFANCHHDHDHDHGCGHHHQEGGCEGHNEFEGGHNEKECEDTGHNHHR